LVSFGGTPSNIAHRVQLPDGLVSRIGIRRCAGCGRTAHSMLPVAATKSLYHGLSRQWRQWKVSEDG